MVTNAGGWGAARGAAIAAAFLILAFIAFGPAISAPFDFDDGPAITENASIRALRPLSRPLHPPADSPVTGRPVANYTFALNYTANKRLGIAQSPANGAADQTTSYHVVNILLHVVTALLLFGIIRRTLRTERIAEQWERDSGIIAFAIALLWLVHPIQTEAVDYVTQRTELLVSACYLATLYASIRAWHSARQIPWIAAAVIACLLGMGSKEVMITVPLTVILYDRAFLANEWRAPWRVAHRRLLYLSLIAATALTAALFAGGARAETVGFGLGTPWYEYLYTQGWAILHYVRLLFWPVGLAFDYGRNPVRGLGGVPGSIAVLAAVIATVAAWRNDKRLWAAFLGAFFFLLLAPSSSIIPVRTEIAAERRVYLASAAVLAFVVIGAMQLIRRMSSRRQNSGARSVAAYRVAGCLLLAIVTVALTATSHARSAQYADLRVRWTDAIAATPTNGRAYDMLAAAELRESPPQIASADSLLHVAMRVDSAFTPALIRSATIAQAEHRFEDAQALLRRALAIHPRDAMATNQLGSLYLAEQRPDLAIPYLVSYADLHPTGTALTRVGLAFILNRQLDSALAPLQRAAAIDPAQVDARRYLGATLVELGRGAEAVPYLRDATHLDPASGILFALLGLADAQAGKVDDASQAAYHAVAIEPANEIVYVFAARAMLASGQPLDAETFLKHAVSLKPNDPQARQLMEQLKTESKGK